jgi:hypothetical protein
MKHYVQLRALFLLLSVISVVLASPPVQVTAQAEEVTIAGCLQTGADEGEFTLTADDKQTYQVQAADGVELAPHANHRVELTGSVDKSDTGAVLKATALKMMAESCEG